MKKGKVYLIGAGPGDPGLITLKGIQCLKKADVIIYDHLVSGEILAHAETTVRMIYAGKEGGRHTLTQEQINRCLVEEAEKGLTVARLKGGDPFIFGRGGEEVEILAHRGIPFEIVPGVTSAIAVPAYAGIPLTHRTHSSTVAFITGHEDPTKGESRIDWQSLAGIETLVFLMGVKNLPGITANLIAAGKPPETPAALIRWGTTAEQETLTAPLAGLAERAKAKGFKPPAILVVGSVVSLQPLLNWFEVKPLFGKGIVITRPEAQADEFLDLLHAEGARTYLFPTIRISPPDNFHDLDQAIEKIETYHWLIFTSANAVRFFFQRLGGSKRDLRDLKGLRIGAIGPTTAKEVERYGISVDLVPSTFTSEGVVEAFRNQDLKGKNVLIPRAEKARDVLPRGLSAAGARVDCVTAYRTVSSERKKAELDGWIKEGLVDVITFTSPSTVENFIKIMGHDYPLPPAVRIACIGPVTAEAARKAGMTVDILQERYTVPALVQTLAEYFSPA
ncbi:MAG TPA: uroporphyrinogen-III C-methyltransferase [Syntrophales bacterium]|nr:uroporphyrinogen-III C-methyltransferase [Syntrophales bacterium]HQA82078.1 uroporphyrinogen-III C-methyltransferase [Syntrophales bacterium]